MKRIALWPVVLLAFLFIAGGASVFAQGTFKIPYKFEAGGKKLPAGIYWVGAKDDGQLVIRQEAKDIEIILPVLQRLAQPTPPVTEPQISPRCGRELRAVVHGIRHGLPLVRSVVPRAGRIPHPLLEGSAPASNHQGRKARGLIKPSWS